MKNVSERERDCVLVEKFRKNPAQRWKLLQGSVSQGIEEGVSAALRKFSAQISEAERHDLIATAMEKALRAIMDGRWEGRSSLRTWSYRIGYNSLIDSLRKSNQNPLHSAVPLDEWSQTNEQGPNPCSSKASVHAYAPEAQTPEDWIMRQQQVCKTSGLRQAIQEWPEPERTLAQVMLDGRANSITAAARFVGEQGYTMYASKARLMLQARLKDYEEWTP